MILTCPSCTMRYLVSEGAIGPEGRKVRCAHCGHQWFQDGEEGLDESLFDTAANDPDLDAAEAALAALRQRLAEGADAPDTVFIDAGNAGARDAAPQSPAAEEDSSAFANILKQEMGAQSGGNGNNVDKAAPRANDVNDPVSGLGDIPQGVRPLPPEADLPLGKKRGFSLPFPNFLKKREAAHVAAQDVTAPSPQARRMGMILAGALFVLAVVVLLLAQPVISRVWPPSNMFYAAIGLDPVLPGQGLVLEELEARFFNDSIALSGSIINLRADPADVPAILATITGEGAGLPQQILIRPPVERLDGESEAVFNIVYPAAPEGAQNVNFAFSFLKAEKDLQIIGDDEGFKAGEAVDAGEGDEAGESSENLPELAQ